MKIQEEQSRSQKSKGQTNLGKNNHKDKTNSIKTSIVNSGFSEGQAVPAQYTTSIVLSTTIQW